MDDGLSTERPGATERCAGCGRAGLDRRDIAVESSRSDSLSSRDFESGQRPPGGAEVTR